MFMNDPLSKFSYLFLQEKDPANPFPFANFEGEVQNFAQNFGDTWIRNNNNKLTTTSLSSFMSTLTTTSKPKNAVGIQVLILSAILFMSQYPKARPIPI